MPNPITLPILEALDYLYKNNLTIDRLWTEQSDAGPPQTHITTKPRQNKKIEPDRTKGESPQ